ncbi:MAG: AAA family ATPase [bacterium]
MSDNAPPPAATDDGDPSFGDRFEIKRCLGARGMGVVYEVVDHHRGERVALKTCRRLDALGLSLFRNEFRALADIDHPHLVRVYELFRPRHAERWFFTMELIDGPTFLPWVRGASASASASAALRTTETAIDTTLRPTAAVSEAPVALDAARHARLRRAAGQLALGVAALHARGLVHRDIKPDNIRVDLARERVVLLDFGLAVRTDGTAGEGADGGWIMGTRGYMSPQQSQGLAPSEADDWYAFGAVLYEALSGQAPRREADGAPPPLPPDSPPDLAGLARALLDPDPARRPVEAEILRRLGVERPHDRPRVELVGRRGVLAALDAALAHSRDGRPGFAHLWGPSGMGKSFAVEAWLADQPPATLVLRGRSHRREDVPFGPFDSLVDDLARRLADRPRAEVEAILPRHIGALGAVFPVLDRLAAVREAPARDRVESDPRLRRDRAAAALREMLGRIADRRPLVVFLDDAQHGGADSAALFEAVFSPPDPPGALVVSTARHAHGSPLIDALRAVAEAHGASWVERCVAIGPLSPDESRQLAGRLLEDRAAERRVDHIAAESGGHPFLLTELAAQTRLRLDISGNLKLGEAIRARVAELPAVARRVLELVALAERPLPGPVVVQAAGADAEEARALATLRAASLVRGGLDPQALVETWHDAIKDAVADGLDPTRRVALHRALAEAIERSELGDPEPLVFHWRQAGDLDRAARWALVGAAAAVDAGAFEQAAALFRQALAANHDEPATRRALAEALQLGGRPDEAADAWIAAAAVAPPAERPALERAAAEQWLVSGRFDRARPLLDRLMRAAGLRVPRRRWVAGLVVIRATIGWWLRGLLGRFDPARVDTRHPDPQLVERFDLLAAPLVGWLTQPPTLLAWTFAHGARLGLACGRADRAALAAGFAGALVTFSNLPGARRAGAHLFAGAAVLGGEHRPSRLALDVARAILTIRSGDWRASFERIRHLSAVLDETPAHNGWEPLAARALDCFGAGIEGRYIDLRARLPELLADARRRGARIEEAFVSLFGGVNAHLTADDPDAAEAALATFHACSVGLEANALTVMASLARLRILRYRGALTEALDGITAARYLSTEGRMDYADFLRLEQSLTALAVPEGATRHRALIRRAVQVLRRSDWGSAPGFARAIEAGLAFADGDPEGAVRRLDDARRAFPLGEPAPRMAPIFDRHRARWLGDPEGIAAADAALRAQGVTHPERWARSTFPLP